jgi:hypothetical protein
MATQVPVLLTLDAILERPRAKLIRRKACHEPLDCQTAHVEFVILGQMGEIHWRENGKAFGQLGEEVTLHNSGMIAERAFTQEAGEIAIGHVARPHQILASGSAHILIRIVGCHDTQHAMLA